MGLGVGQDPTEVLDLDMLDLLARKGLDKRIPIGRLGRLYDFGLQHHSNMA